MGECGSQNLQGHIQQYYSRYSLHVIQSNNLVFFSELYADITHLEAPFSLTLRFLRWNPSLKIGTQYTAITKYSLPYTYIVPLSNIAGEVNIP